MTTKSVPQAPQAHPRYADDKRPSSYTLSRDVHELLKRLKRERGMNYSQSIEVGVRMFAYNVLPKDVPDVPAET